MLLFSPVKSVRGMDEWDGYAGSCMYMLLFSPVKSVRGMDEWDGYAGSCTCYCSHL